VNAPLKFISPVWRFRVFWLFLSFALLLMVGFSVTGEPLNTEASPLGVISFELAGNVRESTNILDHWNQEAQERAAFGLGLDFLFIPIYSTGLVLGCTLAAEVLQRHNWPLNSVGAPLAWTQWLAALLDVVENVALLSILFGMAAVPWPQVARWCALIKFTIVFLGIIYIFYGAVVNLVSRLVSSEGTNF
jgi:hypothetical protein